MGNTVAKGLEAWDSEEGSRLSWKPGGKSGGRVDRCDGGAVLMGTHSLNSFQHLMTIKGSICWVLTQPQTVI